MHPVVTLQVLEEVVEVIELLAVKGERILSCPHIYIVSGMGANP